MANQGEAVIEKPTANEPHPSEKLFMQDHPELVIKEPVKDTKKAEFEKNLDKAVKEVKESPKEESQSTEQQAEAEEAPQVKADEEPAKEEAPPEEVKDDKGEVVEADDDAKFKEYADKNGVTVEEAKAEIEEYDAIVKKYDNDPIKIAKAYKNMQSAYDKQKAAETQNQQARMVSNIMADPVAFVAKGEKEHAPKWIEEYKRMFPAKAELMTDAAIVEECRQVALNIVNRQIGEYQVTLKRESSAKREDLIKTIKDADKPFAAEISRVLRGLPDTQVIDKGFNFEDLVRWARGDDKNIQRLMKQEYERGLKAGQSGEILGEKFVAKASTASKSKPQSSRPAGSELSDYEKRRAREMFSSGYDTDEGCYEAYIDVVKKRSKK